LYSLYCVLVDSCSEFSVLRMMFIPGLGIAWDDVRANVAAFAEQLMLRHCLCMYLSHASALLVV